MKEPKYELYVGQTKKKLTASQLTDRVEAMLEPLVTARELTARYYREVVSVLDLRHLSTGTTIAPATLAYGAEAEELMKKHGFDALALREAVWKYGPAAMGGGGVYYHLATGYTDKTLAQSSQVLTMNYVSLQSIKPDYAWIYTKDTYEALEIIITKVRKSLKQAIRALQNGERFKPIPMASVSVHASTTGSSNYVNVNISYISHPGTWCARCGVFSINDTMHRRGAKCRARQAASDPELYRVEPLLAKRISKIVKIKKIPVTTAYYAPAWVGKAVAMWEKLGGKDTMPLEEFLKETQANER